MNHGEGGYEASYVVTRAGEYQLVVGLGGDPAKSVFKGECAPGPVSPAHCEVSVRPPASCSFLFLSCRFHEPRQERIQGQVHARPHIARALRGVVSFPPLCLPVL